LHPAIAIIGPNGWDHAAGDQGGVAPYRINPRAYDPMWPRIERESSHARGVAAAL